MFFRLVKEIAEKEGITEALKATDQMEWVRRMNAVRETAMGLVNNDRITHNGHTAAGRNPYHRFLLALRIICNFDFSRYYSW